MVSGKESYVCSRNGFSTRCGWQYCWSWFLYSRKETTIWHAVSIATDIKQWEHYKFSLFSIWSKIGFAEQGPSRSHNRLPDRLQCCMGIFKRQLWSALGVFTIASSSPISLRTSTPCYVHGSAVQIMSYFKLLCYNAMLLCLQAFFGTSGAAWGIKVTTAEDPANNVVQRDRAANSGSRLYPWRHCRRPRCTLQHAIAKCCATSVGCSEWNIA